MISMAFEAEFQQLDALNDQGHFKGAYAVVAPDAVLHERAMGQADFEQNLAFTPTTTTAIGSVSKQFTMAAVLQLAEAGKLSLQDPLSDYVPEFDHAEEISLENLLTMQSGITDYTEILVGQLMGASIARGDSQSKAGFDALVAASNDLPKHQLLEILNGHPLKSQPGTEFAYCNANYALLTLVVEAVSHAPFAEYVKANIFQPLGMTTAASGTQYSQANGYANVDGVQTPSGHGNHQAGDGSIVLSLRDFELWAQAILNQKLLSPESWQLAETMHHNIYGMGFMKQGTGVGHGGHIYGFWSGIFISPDQKRATVFLYNRSDSAMAPDQPWTDQLNAWHEAFWQSN